MFCVRCDTAEYAVGDLTGEAPKNFAIEWTDLEVEHMLLRAEAYAEDVNAPIGSWCLLVAPPKRTAKSAGKGKAKALPNVATMTAAEREALRAALAACDDEE